MSKKALTVRYLTHENDFVLDWPAMPGGKQAAVYINGILKERPHTRLNPPMPPLPVEGGLLCPEVLNELERRGFDTKRIRITIPLKVKEIK